MQYDEILEMVITELTERGHKQQRSDNPEVNELALRRIELSGQVQAERGEILGGRPPYEIRELTSEILRLFISRIEVGEKDTKYSRTAEQSIRIIYRDVVIMDSVQLVEENIEQENIA
ncbi:DUF4368 domain-containing protein [Sedimentibacter sp.]|uniref:DUF4368 domain-containing protein n=1 Tax=Sedimentibacter sp. TaxID=1960295 RepID=UPI0028A0584C|nr:DUF4368 domain-containing protein [Sedimentibacter sp.]